MRPGTSGSGQYSTMLAQACFQVSGRASTAMISGALAAFWLMHTGCSRASNAGSRTTWKLQGCRLQELGASTASSRQSRITASGTASGRKRRTARRLSISARSACGEAPRLRSSGEKLVIGGLLGRCPD